MIKAKIDYLKLIFIGVVFGALIFLKPIILLLSFMTLGIVIFLWRTKPTEKTTLAKIVVLGLILRMLFSFVALIYMPLFNIYYPEPPLFMKAIGHTLQLFRDFHREILNGINLGKYFAGGYGDLFLSEVLKEVAVEGKTSFLHIGAYIQGLLNFIFGESALNILVYPLLGVWSIVLVYYLTKEVYDRNAAIIASFVLAILPSFIIWDCINIRMSISILCLLLINWSVLKFRRCNHIKYLIPLFIAILFFSTAKDKFFMPITLITILILFLSINFKRPLKKILITLTIAIFLLLIKTNPLVKSKIHTTILNIIINQKSFYLYESGNNYKIYPEFVYHENLEKISSSKITALTLLKALPKGSAYFLFAPFPWAVTNTLRLYSYPQILFWYFMFPFAIWGILIGLRRNRADTSLILLFLLFWIMLFSLTMGNEGTAARHRDFVSPFFYIFASVALCYLLGTPRLKGK